MVYKLIDQETAGKAAFILTTAFEKDPIFKFIFKTPEAYRRKAPWLFASWVRWAIKFGDAWMSPDEKAVLLFRKIGDGSMSFKTMVSAGMLATPFKIGFGAFYRFYFGIVMLLDKKHAELMGDKTHWYGWMAGSTEQKKGNMRLLFDQTLIIADQKNIPVFLETGNPDTLPLYRAKNFALKSKHSVTPDCTIWFLVREPNKII